MLHAHPPSVALFPCFFPTFRLDVFKKKKTHTDFVDILDGLTIDGVLLLRLVMS